jgi:hypothetical protein
MLKGSVREGLALKICHEIKQRFDVRIRLAVSVISLRGSGSCLQAFESPLPGAFV